MNRRSFVKGTILSSAGLALALDARGQAQPQPATVASAVQAALPKGKIGKLEVSRLILGGNLLTHYTHSRDLRYVYGLAAHYNTDEKIMETLALAESEHEHRRAQSAHPISVLRRYRKERGGKISGSFDCPVEPDAAKIASVEDLMKDGCDAIYLWGVTPTRGEPRADRPAQQSGRVAEGIRRALRCRRAFA